MKQTARTIAALIIDSVLSQQRSLSESAPALLDQLKDPRERALAQEISFGVLRWYYQLDSLIASLLQRPLKRRHSLIQALLLSGAYQICHLRTPHHAVVSTTVDAAKQFGANWASALINGTLRNLIRKREYLLLNNDQSDQCKFAHPQWLINEIHDDWPEHWQQLLEHNNQLAGLSLRVNQLKTSRDHYLTELERAEIRALATPDSQTGITLAQSMNPVTLPGFTEGKVSVQDIAAQLAAPLLALKPGLRVLDACAAPGGKTAHILESEPKLSGLVAIDKSEKRNTLLRQTLQRLDLMDEKVTIINSDATETGQWWDGIPFDRILLDAPCSATGVIRRHPDIKYHRRKNDIETLVHIQRNLLNNLWPLLASGGRLVYVTCSILKKENRDQIAWFLDSQPSASELEFEASWGHKTQPGRQILPGEKGMDGFYYACLVKA